MSLFNKFSFYINDDIPAYGIESTMMDDSSVVRSIGYGTCIWHSATGDILAIECLYPGYVSDEIDFPIEPRSVESPCFSLPSSDLSNESICVYNSLNIFIIKWGVGRVYRYGVNGVIFIENNIVTGVGVLKEDPQSG